MSAGEADFVEASEAVLRPRRNGAQPAPKGRISARTLQTGIDRRKVVELRVAAFCFGAE